MRSLLPHGLTIERPSFEVCEDSTFPSLAAFPRHSAAVLPPLSHVPECALQPTAATMPDSQTTLKHSIKNQGLELRCLQEAMGNRYSGQGKNQLHPLTVNVTASKESLLSSSHRVSPSRPVCVPLTMSELLETSVTKVRHAGRHVNVLLVSVLNAATPNTYSCMEPLNADTLYTYSGTPQCMETCTPYSGYGS